MTALDFEQRYTALRKMVDRRTASLARRGKPAELNEGCRYVLSGGGKRVRAVLVLLSCEAVGGKIERALDAGVAEEVGQRPVEARAGPLAPNLVRCGDQHDQVVAPLEARLEEQRHLVHHQPLAAPEPQRAQRTASRKGSPDMEPELSITNTISFGVIVSAAADAGGWKSSINCPPRSPLCARRAISGFAPATS